VSTAAANPWPHAGYLELTDGDPVIADLQRVPETQRENLSTVGDNRWDLTPLLQKQTVTGTLNIVFDTFPPRYIATAKRLVWASINKPTPMEDLERSAAARSQLSPATVYTFARMLRQWMIWLADKDIDEFCAVTEDTFNDYADHLKQHHGSRENVGNVLFAVTRAWLYAPYLPEADRLARPPWENSHLGRTSVLGPANWSSENKTPPIHPQTMASLLVWSLRFVTDFSDDILAAKKLKATPRDVPPSLQGLTHYQRFRAYAEKRRQESATVPGWVAPNRPHMRSLAKGFIGWQLGLSPEETKSIGPHYLAADLSPSDEAHLPMPITGAVDGKEWTPAIGFYEVEELCRHLATAAFVVVAYLTGMRGEECRALERSCCRTRTDSETGQLHYRIHGRTFKGALDKSGNAIPAGVEREQPWLAIAPVAKAVAVMEALNPTSQLLFPIDAFSLWPRGVNDGKAVHARMVGDRIQDLIDWSNRAATRLGRPHEVIPADPEEAVTVRRFRRTLAWFIYRKPGGRVALGVQYGHLRGYTTDGYGSRVASGLRDVFPMEEALARADYLEHAHQRLENGEQVSGPAAGRYTQAIHLFDREFRGRYMSNKQAAALRANPQLRIYDNPQQFVTCCYDQSKALCHPDRQITASQHRSPDVSHCQPGCGNVARTDQNISQIQHAIAQHQAEIASPTTPIPLRGRLEQRVTALQTIVDEHQHNEKS
jgi:integrase